MLTTVVTLDPIYAYFDMDEPTLLGMRNAIPTRARSSPSGQSGLEVSRVHGTSGRDGVSPRGDISTSWNNQLNPTTGSILVRGIFPNDKPAGGTRLLSPGIFVRIRLPFGDPHPAVLIIDQAISVQPRHQVCLRC